MALQYVAKTDPAVASAISQELARQRGTIELIASENIASPSVMEAMGSVLTNKYAEGYPGKRYYGGCEKVDLVEDLARDRACELFGAGFANVQPHSGAQANFAAYTSIIELGDKKQAVTSEDLPYIIADVLKQDVYETQVHILNYNLSLSQGLRPVATLKIRINDEEYEQTSSGDGQYDAFMRALRKIYKEQLRREFPMLVNYTVSIPPGGRTDAFVQTYITWEYRGETFKTRGLDADQTEAAIKATIKMLNIIEPTYNDHGC